MKPSAIHALALSATFLAFSGYGIAQSSTTQLVEGNAQLESPLNAKSAKQGDVVTAKLTSSVKAQGIELPRGTKLVGHVDQVSASDAKNPSKLVLTFDKAQLKDGKEIAIKSTIAGFAPASEAVEIPSQVASDATFDQRAGGARGVSLHSAVQESSSGTLTDERRDVSLSRGTQLLIAVAPQLDSASTAGAQ